MTSVRVVMPVREFLFTLDQIALMLNVTEAYLYKRYIFFEGVTTGPTTGRMRARDICVDGTHRDWRVGESQYRMFLKRRGFIVVDPIVR